MRQGYVRTRERRAHWRSLTPNQRRILTSHLPDELEREMALCASVLTALENVYGPREWTPALARTEEGEAEPERCKEDDFAMSFNEIAEEMKVSTDTVRYIINRSIRKLRIEFSRRGLSREMRP